MTSVHSETKKYSFFKILAKIIPLLFKTMPLNFAIENIGAVFHGLSFALSVMATQFLFDTISRAAAGKADIRDCILALLTMAGITFGQQILNGLQNFHAMGVFFPKSTGKLTSLLHRKIKRIDPAKFEDTAFLDDLNKAREGVSAVTMCCMICFVFVSFYGVYFGTIGVYLFRLKPLLLITLLLAFLPALLSQSVSARIFTKLEEESAPLRREYEYYQKTICDREYFKETRLLGAFHFFHKLFSDTMKLLTRKIWKAEHKTSLLQLMLNMITFSGMAASAYILFTASLAGEISVGAFAAVFAALGQIFAIMQEIITQHIGNLNKDIGKVTNFIRMLEMPERTGSEGTQDFREGVIAENISFTYPGRDTPAIQNVSLTLHDGETIAIVGENGAGKSTLVRLLTGIYQPSEGSVSVGGLDTIKTAPESVYKGISGVFQKYQRYKMTLNENVSISDFPTDSNPDRINKALQEAGAELDDIKPDEMLSPEFDGIDLSGGQWQRIAIARGLYRANHFIVLDEPTSAIDPIEETRIYSQFQKLAEGKCAIVVTHRLGSAKLAERVVVIDSGRIVDIGTHGELLSRPGKYAQMWAAQTKWYERSETVID